MKKIILAFSFLLTFVGFSFAQATPAKAKKGTTASATAKPATAAVHAKKDGTADMRYKENKNGAKAQTTTHLKKDGTADKRFKENKAK